jgi:hypothetical protein
MKHWTAAPSARRGVLLALSLTTALGLAGCGSIDDMLFGSDTPEPAAPAASAPSAGGQGTFESSAPGTMPGSTEGGQAGTAPAGATTAGITPITIDPGSDTGTAVSHTIQSLRSDVAGIQDKVMADAQQLAEVRAASFQASQQYHEAKSTVTARLQLGTTRGNPELVSQWNNAQSALDSMTTNINSLNALGTDIANESSAAHFALTTIEATFGVSGAIDEDHHQLSVLRDETDQIIVIIDSLLNNVSDTVQRQTGYVANERASLTTLASAIKEGSYYGDLSGPMAASPSYMGGPAGGGPVLVTIRFDHPRVDYQQILYTAVAQTLQSRPGSGFAVVAVSPTRGTAAAVQLAQTEAERHGRDVLRSLTDMGVPATRLDLSSSTDPRASTSEVRVYVR